MTVRGILTLHFFSSVSINIKFMFGLSVGINYIIGRELTEEIACMTCK